MRAYERLLNYVKYPTASCESSETCPSTASQLILGRDLVKEMKELGVADAHIDDFGYVYGTIPGNIEHYDGVKIGFLAHMDVTDEAPSENIQAQVITRDGREVVTTDGTTLLGADDKAGVAEIMTMAEYFYTHPEVPHGPIPIAFTVDEEIGRGADHFDVAHFGADFAYTVDGGAFGVIEYETFNAAAARLRFHGVSMHPGYAKDKMVNAADMMFDFYSRFPRDERPETTDRREGYYFLADVEGSVEEATAVLTIRDFDRESFEKRKAFVAATVDGVNAEYAEKGAKIDCEIKDSYYNMLEALKPHWHLVEAMENAIRSLGATPVGEPVRGGTDGSRLSYMGLPCPNLCTGAYNIHSRIEYADVQEMDQCVEVLIHIAKHYATVKP